MKFLLSFLLALLATSFASPASAQSTGDIAVSAGPDWVLQLDLPGTVDSLAPVSTVTAHQSLQRSNFFADDVEAEIGRLYVWDEEAGNSATLSGIVNAEGFWQWAFTGQEGTGSATETLQKTRSGSIEIVASGGANPKAYGMVDSHAGVTSTLLSPAAFESKSSFAYGFGYTGSALTAALEAALIGIGVDAATAAAIASAINGSTGTGIYSWGNEPNSTHIATASGISQYYLESDEGAIGMVFANGLVGFNTASADVENHNKISGDIDLD